MWKWANESGVGSTLGALETIDLKTNHSTSWLCLWCRRQQADGHVAAKKTTPRPKTISHAAVTELGLAGQHAVSSVPLLADARCGLHLCFLTHPRAQPPHPCVRAANRWAFSQATL